MSDTIKYYYSRRRDNHYDSTFHIMMENRPKGYAYLNLLEKLTQLSLAEKGRLVLPDGRPYSLQMLSAITRHDVETIKEGIDIFQENKLIEVLQNGTIYILNIHEMIGKSSTEGDRKKIRRLRIEAEKEGKPFDESDYDDKQDKCPPEKNENQSDNQSDNQNHNHNKYHSRQKQRTADDGDIPAYTNAFEELWDMYPRKEAKRPAFKAYLDALAEGVSDEIIAEGIEKYNRHISEQRNDKEYIVTGGNWFNDRRWEDEYNF